MSASATARVRWRRVILIGIAAEFALILVIIPVYFLPNRMAAINMAIVPASFVVLLGFGYWAARRAPGRFALHGLLTGVTAVLFYLAMPIIASAFPGAPKPDFALLFSPAYLLAHTAKLVGATLGGMLAGRAAHG